MQELYSFRVANSPSGKLDGWQSQRHHTEPLSFPHKPRRPHILIRLFSLEGFLRASPRSTLSCHVARLSKRAWRCGQHRIFMAKRTSLNSPLVRYSIVFNPMSTWPCLLKCSMGPNFSPVINIRTFRSVSFITHPQHLPFQRSSPLASSTRKICRQRQRGRRHQFGEPRSSSQVFTAPPVRHSLRTSCILFRPGRPPSRPRLSSIA